jgi:hypothetical protein
MAGNIFIFLMENLKMPWFMGEPETHHTSPELLLRTVRFADAALRCRC